MSRQLNSESNINSPCEQYYSGLPLLFILLFYVLEEKVTHSYLTALVLSAFPSLKPEGDVTAELISKQSVKTFQL